MSPSPTTTIPQILKDCRAAMDKALESARRELGSIRSGKATPALLDTDPRRCLRAIDADQPGRVRLGARAPAADRDAVGQGADQGDRKGDSRVGSRTRSRGAGRPIIRVPLPSLNEQRRRDLVKVVHKLAEEGRVAHSACPDGGARPAQEDGQGVGGRREARREGAAEAA